MPYFAVLGWLFAFKIEPSPSSTGLHQKNLNHHTYSQNNVKKPALEGEPKASSSTLSSSITSSQASLSYEFFAIVILDSWQGKSDIYFLLK